MLPEDVSGMCGRLRTWAGRFASFLLPLAENVGILSSGISLFLVRDLLESVEFFSVKFIELRVDVLGRVS